MLSFSKKSEVKKAISSERELISSYKDYELGMKETVETYLSEFNNVCFDNDTFKTMLVNNFENATTQLDNNILDIESVENVLDILESQKDISTTDVETYNKLLEKTRKDIELTQNFMQKTVSCFENISMSGKKKSIAILEECKGVILNEFPFSNVVPEHQEVKEVVEEKPQKKIEIKSKTIKKTFDYASSDLLCFFPKDKNDNLVLSTIQDNYKISFNDATATISIEKENFNISLNTPGVQISNSNTNNILYVSHAGGKYTIITNNQIEIPYFIQVSKVAKNDDFLEIEIARDSLTLDVEDNILNFEDNEQKNNVFKNIPINDADEIVETAPVSKVNTAAIKEDWSKKKIVEDAEPVLLPGLEPEAEIEPEPEPVPVVNKVEPKVIPVAVPEIAPTAPQTTAAQVATTSAIEAPVQSEPVQPVTIQQTIPAQPAVAEPIVQAQTATVAQPAVTVQPATVAQPVVAQPAVATPVINPQVNVVPQPAVAPQVDTSTVVAIPQVAPVQQVVTPQVNPVQTVVAPQTEVVNPVVAPQADQVQESANTGKHSAEGYESEIGDNDTLIISDTNKTVILPYKIADLEKKLQKSKKYKTLKDVVDAEYTIPIDTFKNPVKSRFREAFQLIKKKEHGSLKEAVGLGFELMFQSNLNPAVIAACKDLDELDIYLDCLDDNELDKFSCFKISYAVPPSKH